jgi:hypothetical protein
MTCEDRSAVHLKKKNLAEACLGHHIASVLASVDQAVQQALEIQAKSASKSKAVALTIAPGKIPASRSVADL